jgi:hypothetical protein
MKFLNYITETDNYKTKKDQTGHLHEARVNADGDGATLSTEGNAEDHIHKIFQWIVQPAHGHIHNLDV